MVTSVDCWNPLIQFGIKINSHIEDKAKCWSHFKCYSSLSLCQSLRFLAICFLWECWNWPVSQPRSSTSATAATRWGGREQRGKTGGDATESFTFYTSSSSSCCKWLKIVGTHIYTHRQNRDLMLFLPASTHFHTDAHQLVFILTHLSTALQC